MPIPDQTPSHQRLYGLDHLRALAISYVFLFHYFILSKGQPAWLPGFAKFGWSGVDLFFVLSGFLISSQLFTQIRNGQRISFRRFFLSRFFRIVPAFLAVVALYFAVPAFREKTHLPPLWKFLTFTQNFGLNLKDAGAFSHGWSLCVEEHFYLLLPLTLLALQSKKAFAKAAWILVILFLSGFAIRAYSFQHFYLPSAAQDDGWVYWYQHLYYPTYTRLDGLLAGVGIAATRVFLPARWSRISRHGNLLFVFSLLVLIGANFLCEDQQTFAASVFGFPVVAIGYGLMVASAVSETSFLYRWKSKATTLIATLSYAVYLSHKGLVHVTHRLLAHLDLDANLMLLICIVATLLGAVVLHVVVEKPFMRLRTRLLAKR